MRTAFIAILILFVSLTVSKSQELFPHNEPASSIPKGVLGIRYLQKNYQDISVLKNMFALRFMYGLTPKLSVFSTITTTNHHGKNLPPNLVSHTHGNNTTTYSSATPDRGLKYPYLLSGIYLYAKYRFITIDSKNAHFRVAAYGEWSNVRVAHDETEPNLMDDTKGYGGGFIFTYLKNHFAVSLTSGVIIPGKFQGSSPDSAGPNIPTRIQYGKAWQNNLSFGYLLYPRHYKNYKQTNISVYAEFISKTFEQAKVTQYGFVNVPINTPLLQAGYYVEVHPGIQGIFNSNLRVDLSMGFPLISRSYAHYYPVFYVGIQRYFFFGKK